MTTIKPGEDRVSGFQGCPHHIIKFFQFSAQIMRHAKKKGSMAQEGKRQSVETIPEEAQEFVLLHKDFNSAL